MGGEFNSTSVLTKLASHKYTILKSSGFRRTGWNWTLGGQIGAITHMKFHAPYDLPLQPLQLPWVWIENHTVRTRRSTLSRWWFEVTSNDCRTDAALENSATTRYLFIHYAPRPDASRTAPVLLHNLTHMTDKWSMATTGGEFRFLPTVRSPIVIQACICLP